jgi:ribonuclease HII
MTKISLEMLELKIKEKIEYDKNNSNGELLVGGMDEVGRGPLAGPVISALVVLKKDSYILGIDDSKKISKKKREQLFEQIMNDCIDYSIGISTVEEIDEINILQATKLSMRRAYENISIKPNIVLIDAVDPNIPVKIHKTIKGDEKSYVIGASSIVAKVIRDRLMEDYSKEYKGYGFEKNSGYGTKQHIEKLREIGATPIHRKTFIKKLV